MDHRHRPDGPPGEESAGWVIAGEEHSWPPGPGNGRGYPDWSRYGTERPPEQSAPAYDPGYGGARYGEPGTAGYLDPEYPTGSYPAGPAREPYPPAAGYPPPQRPDPGYPPSRPGAYPGQSRAPMPPHGPAEDEPAGQSWLPALVWTVGLFVLPVLLYLGWTLTLGEATPAGCVDAAGAACPPPRTEAVRQLVDVLPGVAGALALSLLVALGLRRSIGEWRDLTVGLAAAVIGAGLATLVGSILG